MSELKLAPVVTSTKAAKYYGVRVATRYDPVVDKGQPTYTDYWDEKIRCTRMDWFIRKVSHLTLFAMVRPH